MDKFVSDNLRGLLEYISPEDVDDILYVLYEGGITYSDNAGFVDLKLLEYAHKGDKNARMVCNQAVENIFTAIYENLGSQTCDVSDMRSLYPDIAELNLRDVRLMKHLKRYLTYKITDLLSSYHIPLSAIAEYANDILENYDMISMPPFGLATLGYKEWIPPFVLITTIPDNVSTKDYKKYYEKMERLIDTADVMDFEKSFDKIAETYYPMLLKNNKRPFTELLLLGNQPKSLKIGDTVKLVGCKVRDLPHRTYNRIYEIVEDLKMDESFLSIPIDWRPY